MGIWVSGVWLWNLRWHRRIFVWEGFLWWRYWCWSARTILVGADSWSLKHSPKGVYLVRSACDPLLYHVLEEEGRVSTLPHFLARVWCSWAPSKVLMFSQQLLLDRIPFRANFLRKMIINMPACACFPLSEVYRVSGSSFCYMWCCI